jgi:hypothetical protein
VGAGDADLRRLREALAGLVAEDLPELLAEARTEARARVRAVLTEVMAEAMLEQVRRPAPADAPRSAPAEPPPPPPASRPSPPATAQTGPSEETDDLGYYVYGVTTADGAAAPEVTGVDPAHPVTILAAGDLGAVVGRVPLSEFNEHRLREHLSDLAWVETIARRHEEVLEAAAARGTVIPMRLCSIYRDAAGVRAMLEREAGPMRDALRLVAGRAEWAVKVFSVSLPPPAPDSDRSAPDTGAAYLEQRRRAQRTREAVDDRQAAACEAIHARLGALAVRALAIAPQRPEVSGHDGEMLLNGVYLVDDTALTSFHRQIQALRDEFGAVGLELVATGPWPAYNFVPDAIGVPA